MGGLALVRRMRAPLRELAVRDDRPDVPNRPQRDPDPCDEPEARVRIERDEREREREEDDEEGLRLEEDEEVPVRLLGPLSAELPVAAILGFAADAIDVEIAAELES